MQHNRERQITRFRKLLLFSGTFNIVLASPLVFPQTLEWYFKVLWDMNHLLQLNGRPLIPPTEGIHALLANTAGVDLVLIGALVIYASLDPIKRMAIPLLNAAGRSLFALVVIYYSLVFNIARVIVVIGIIDVIIGAGFIYYYFKLKDL